MNDEAQRGSCGTEEHRERATHVRLRHAMQRIHGIDVETETKLKALAPIVVETAHWALKGY